MVGGHDVSVKTHGKTKDVVLSFAVRCVMRLWPGAIVQDGITGELFKSYADIPFGETKELFVYRDQAALDIWDKLGASSTNRNTMVHLVPGSKYLTVVVDDPGDRVMDDLIRGMREAFDVGFAQIG